MRSRRPGTTRVRAAIVGALVLVATLTLGSGMAIGAPQVPFSVSPSGLSLTADVGAFDYELMTVTTGKKKVALENPASFGAGSRFFDTQAGSCWQTYGVSGLRIPANASCTIQVGFRSSSAGTFNDVMTVYACPEWHVDGGIVCDARDASQTVALTGTAAAATCSYTAGRSGCIVLTNVAITDTPSTATYTLSGQLTFTPTCQLGASGCVYATGDPLYTGSGTFSVTGSQTASGTWAVPASFNDGAFPYNFTDSAFSSVTCASATIRTFTPNIELTASGGLNVGGFLFIRQDNTGGTTSRVSATFQTGVSPILPPGTFNNPFNSLSGVTILC